ncbi:hypothetical protein G7054_g13286 [Neopestalotiopsis clavispora]|nr:hypothetical protein G7054_g13286 [Neopestalotiopsis clavispora]
MVTTSTNPHYSQQGASSHYMATEGGSQAYGWVESISIEDDDLMFGGKSLSAWHEEGRQKVSYPEEERRGRQRVRQHHSYSQPPQESKSSTKSQEQSKQH